MAALVLGTIARPLGAQEAPDAEKLARQQRQGAGVRAGAWRVEQEAIAGVSRGETPALEGYFQRGLDLHLAIESTAGYWRQRQTSESQGTLGGTVREEVTSHVVPLFTAIKLYPFTRPSHRLEPLISAGVGLAIGVEERSGSGGGLLGPASGGPSVVTGFGAKGGAGVEWRFSRAFALNASGRYQWIRFGQELGGERTYQGPVFEGGVSYRFQYR